MSFIIGNVVTVLMTDEEPLVTVATNVSVPGNYSDCGLYYEGAGSAEKSKELSKSQFYSLLGVFLGMQGVGSVMLFMLRLPSNDKIETEESLNVCEGYKCSHYFFINVSALFFKI